MNSKKNGFAVFKIHLSTVRSVLRLRLRPYKPVQACIFVKIQLVGLIYPLCTLRTLYRALIHLFSVIFLSGDMSTVCVYCKYTRQMVSD